MKKVIQKSQFFQVNWPSQPTPVQIYYVRTTGYCVTNTSNKIKQNQTFMELQKKSFFFKEVLLVSFCTGAFRLSVLEFFYHTYSELAKVALTWPFIAGLSCVLFSGYRLDIGLCIGDNFSHSQDDLKLMFVILFWNNTVTLTII